MDHCTEPQSLSEPASRSGLSGGSKQVAPFWPIASPAEGGDDCSRSTLHRSICPTTRMPSTQARPRQRPTFLSNQKCYVSTSASASDLSPPPPVAARSSPPTPVPSARIDGSSTWKQRRSRARNAKLREARPNPRAAAYSESAIVTPMPRFCDKDMPHSSQGYIGLRPKTDKPLPRSGQIDQLEAIGYRYIPVSDR